MITPGLDQFVEKARSGNLVPVYREILADTETPVSAFLKVGNRPHSFLLESVQAGEQIGPADALEAGIVVALRDEGRPACAVIDNADLPPITRQIDRGGKPRRPAADDETVQHAEVTREGPLSSEARIERVAQPVAEQVDRQCQ